jgi:hypothetical protein
MNPTCQCGMSLDERSTHDGCQECGTACCLSCAIQVGARTYCRWCALAAGRVA